MNKEEIQKSFKDNHIKVIRCGDIEIPVEYLKQTTVNVNGDDYIKLQQENKQLKEENQSLKKQLEYLRSGEYLNQLRFERDMLQDLVDEKEISKEDKEFIDMTHRNTELLEQQKEFIEYMNKTIEELECDDVDDEEMKGYLIQRIDTFKEILSKYKEITGGKNE